MMLEVRKALVWGTAVAAVASAMLLASNGGGMPRIPGDAALVRVAPIAPSMPNGSHTAVGAGARHSAPAPAGSAH